MTPSRTERLATHGVLLLFAALAVAPLVGIVLTALNGTAGPVSGFAWPETLTFDNVSRAWDAANLSSALVSSALVSAGVVALTVTLSVLAGYAFALLDFRGRNVLFGVLLLGFVVPSEAVVIPLYYDVRAYTPFLDGTYALLILAETARFVAFGAFWMRAFFGAIPRSLVDAAMLDGAGPWRTLWRVALPPAKPAIVTLVVIIFLWSWNEFLLPLVLFAATPENVTAPVSLAVLTGRNTTDVTGLAAGSLMIALPVVLLYAFFQRQLIRGVLSGAVKG